MSVSVRTRFEVFKRDRFTCHYCGKHPPDVLLEADHIVPRAAGGTDEMANLITACQDCNRGKGSGLLHEGSAPVVRPATIEELNERIEQAKAYMEAVGGIEAVRDEQVDRVNDAWARAFGADLVETETETYWQLASGRFLNRTSLRTILRRLPLDRVLEAVDVTADRWGVADYRTCRYFYGVCWRMIRQIEGRGDPGNAGPETAISDDPLDAALEAERRRIGRTLKCWAEEGYSSLADAVLALFPDDD